MRDKTPAQRLTRPFLNRLRRTAAALLTLACTLAVADTARPMPDAVPPFILEGVTPNLIITLDNCNPMRPASSFDSDALISTEGFNDLNSSQSRYFTNRLRPMRPGWVRP